MTLSLEAWVGKKMPRSPQHRNHVSDNGVRTTLLRHPEETSMLRRTVIFFVITLGLPVITAIAIAWAR